MNAKELVDMLLAAGVKFTVTKVNTIRAISTGYEECCPLSAACRVSFPEEGCECIALIKPGELLKISWPDVHRIYVAADFFRHSSFPEVEAELARLL